MRGDYIMDSNATQLDMYIEKLLDKENLTGDDISDVYRIMVSGQANPVTVSAFLTLLHQKGETPEEIHGFASALRRNALTISPRTKEPLMDTCGTGGDGHNTFNISTASMFVLATDGIPVAKHGNRAITSKCGCADLLTALGIKIDLPAQKVCESIENIGIGFMFAPLYHPTMKYIMPIRKNLPFRTVFNILGPLANPAKAQRHVLGVYHPDLIKPMAQVLSKLGVTRGLVFSGYVPQTKSYMDEISPCGVTHCAHIVDGDISYFDIDASEFDLQPSTLDDIKGYTASENAKIALQLFSGHLNTPITDVVKLNAGAGFYIAGKVKDIKSGVEYAGEVIKSGRITDLLNKWRAVSV